ncbi:uncharacterized protein, YigZ family [Pelagirhabdus alkalitolerans]|uniref:Uncharacterized protein, YigZ family n=1 Tax=Pelagirhabdus alkalitolerans TaxID=1612202 RepID=A0A1G6L3L2_9BACI|nr:YigZ family protein [Pelagirhabdus alkalitolerans]SDC37691.1 uncharacterized protein, YigZ family [Pelagirhabdus alkalitolerans]
MLKHYKTVRKEETEEVIIQKSRFIGHVKRTETEEEAQAFIEQIKKEHNQANHNCSAYLIGEHDSIQKANDDGEPSQTAGAPMLNVLKQQALKDTCIVITRYFGGIKLGAGGLIRAYSNTTTETLKKAGLVNRHLVAVYTITIDYTLLGKVENALRQSEYIIDHIDYLDTVKFKVFVKVDDQDAFETWLVDLTSDQANMAVEETRYIEEGI